MTMVPNDYFEAVCKQGREQDAPVDQLLHDLHIDPEKVKERGSISDFVFSQFYQGIMRTLQDEWFGMFAGGRVPLGAFRLMLSTVIHSHNLRQGIIASGEFAEICRGLNMRLIINEQEEDDYATLTIGPTRSFLPDAFKTLEHSANPNHLFASLFAYHRCHCWATSSELKILTLGVSFREQDSILPLSQFRADQILTGQKHNFIVYKKSDLELPIVQNYDSVIEFVRTAPFHIITLDKTQVTTAEKVRAILDRDVSGTMPGAEEVASQLHMSATSLRRKLQAENTSFQALKDECRLVAALHYLSCLDLTNTQVAEKLGFDEPSAFFRAFKKWTGETPGNYRKRFDGHNTSDKV